jgi:hypothetical protein
LLGLRSLAPHSDQFPNQENCNHCQYRDEQNLFSLQREAAFLRRDETGGKYQCCGDAEIKFTSKRCRTWSREEDHGQIDGGHLAGYLFQLA